MRILRTIPVILLAVLAPAGCGKEPAHPPGAMQPPIVRGVTIGVVTVADVDEMAEVVGTVKSRTSTTLSSRLVGTIIALHVREGSQVEEGQVLLELDDRDIAARIRRAEAGVREGEAALGETERAVAAATAARTAAEAQRDLAAATLARYQRLLDRKSVAPLEYDQVAARHKAAVAEVERAAAEIQVLHARRQQVLARIEGAKAEVSSAQIMHGYARIAAPITGVVAAKHVDVGSLAAPGSPLLTVEDSRRYWLEVAVPESLAATIRRGQFLEAAVEAATLSANARVSDILPAADPSTRTTLVRLDLPPSPRLRSGLFGRARVPAGRRQAVQVARQAVVERGQLQGVYVVGQDGIARFRLVRTGQTRLDATEILSGLTGGEQVIVAGVEQVTDGARIEPEGGRR